MVVKRGSMVFWETVGKIWETVSVLETLAVCTRYSILSSAAAYVFLLPSMRSHKLSRYHCFNSFAVPLRTCTLDFSFERDECAQTPFCNKNFFLMYSQTRIRAVVTNIARIVVRLNVQFASLWTNFEAARCPNIILPSCVAYTISANNFMAAVLMLLANSDVNFFVKGQILTKRFITISLLASTRIFILHLSFQ